MPPRKGRGRGVVSESGQLCRPGTRSLAQGPGAPLVCAEKLSEEWATALCVVSSEAGRWKSPQERLRLN